jgi:2-polyprenyl-3-methyl-5-hydroxy-6-metoxy-1,4-benzoquinol methylase
MDSLPFWQGVKQSYGAFQALPFELELSAEGVITQKADVGRLNTIRKAYEGLEYEHPTRIAGQSAWGNKLHGINLDFLLSARADFRNCTVVEIGGGNLALSRPLLEKGIAKFVSVDPTIREVSSDEKIQVVKEFFSPTVAARISSADVVASFGCLEHVFDPLEFLTGIRRMLVDDGIAVLTLPNVTTQLRTGDLNALWHEHISYFTESSLRKTVAQAGLEFVLLDAAGDRFAIVLRKKLRQANSAVGWLRRNFLQNSFRRQFNSLRRQFRTILSMA